MSLFILTSSSGEAYTIKGETIFGRGSECTYRLEDAEVSRKHATFFIQGGSLVVKDEASANGTYVNGQKLVGQTTLKDGDRIRMGQTVMIAQVPDVEDATPTVFAPEEVPLPKAAPPLSAPPLPVLAPGPARPVESTPISEVDLGPVKKSKLPALLIGCGGLVVVMICVLAVVFIVSRAGFFQDLLGGLDLFSSNPDVFDYSLVEVLQEETTDDRPGVMGYLGRPDAFTISAITMEGVPVRVETWRYFAFQMRVDFVDGEATWTMDIEPAPEYSIMPAWYDPLEFELGMSEAEVVSVVALASPAGQAPQATDLSDGGEDLVGSTMLVGDQILIGLDPSGVVFVETIALFPEGEGGS